MSETKHLRIEHRIFGFQQVVVWNPEKPLIIGNPARFWFVLKKGLILFGPVVGEMQVLEVGQTYEHSTGKLHLQWVDANQGLQQKDLVKVPQVHYQGTGFKPTLWSGAIALLVALGGAQFTGSEKTEVGGSVELSPQIAKIVMKPVKKLEASRSNRGGRGLASAQARSQALRSGVMNKALGQLMKSSLSASQMMTSSGVQAIANGQALLASAQAMKSLGNGGKSALAGLIGGAAGGGERIGGNSGAVGYGSGTGAKLAGQGNEFFALDLSTADIEEGLTKDEVGKVIYSHIDEIRYCYESALVKDPTIEGKLTVDFTISGAGQVKAVATKDNQSKSDGLAKCLTGRLAKWRFPNPKGGVEVSVSYPFHFKNLWR